MTLELFRAVQNSQQHDAFVQLLKASKDFDHTCQDQNGDSILVFAVKARKSSAVRELLQHGFPPDYISNGQSTTALWHAVQLNHIEIVQMLLDKGAKTNQSYYTSQAIDHQNEALLTLLCAHGAKTTGCLKYAVEVDSAPMVKTLLNVGADPNELEANTEKSLLMLAASKGNEDILQLLLNSKANFCKVDGLGHTAIHYAAAYQTQIDVDSFPLYPRKIAVLPTERDFISIVRRLHTLGVNVNTIDQLGYSALHLAALFGHAKLIEVLLELGADVNVKSPDGCTALMTAMGGGSSLSEERSWFTPPYNSYRKRTVLATTADYINVVTQLRTAGIDINAQDDNGNTALMNAEFNYGDDSSQYLTLLTNTGADPLIKKKNNLSISQEAAAHGHDEATVAMLMAAEVTAAAAGTTGTTGAGSNKAKSKRKAEEAAEPVEDKKEGGCPRRSTAGPSTSSSSCSTSQAGGSSSSFTTATATTAISTTSAFASLMDDDEDEVVILGICQKEALAVPAKAGASTRSSAAAAAGSVATVATSAPVVISNEAQEDVTLNALVADPVIPHGSLLLPHHFYLYHHLYLDYLAG